VSPTVCTSEPRQSEEREGFFDDQMRYGIVPQKPIVIGQAARLPARRRKQYPCHWLDLQVRVSSPGQQLSLYLHHQGASQLRPRH
jgi:hypothetical protein